VTNTIRVVWGAFVGGAYAEGHLVGGVPDCEVQIVSGDNSAGAGSNGRGDDVDGGESVGLTQKLLSVT
jgi:hypothetical protein